MHFIERYGVWQRTEGIQGKSSHFILFVLPRQIIVWSLIDAYCKEIYFAFFVIFNFEHDKAILFG